MDVLAIETSVGWKTSFVGGCVCCRVRSHIDTRLLVVQQQRSDLSSSFLPLVLGVRKAAAANPSSGIVRRLFSHLVSNEAKHSGTDDRMFCAAVVPNNGFEATLATSHSRCYACGCRSARSRSRASGGSAS